MTAKKAALLRGPVKNRSRRRLSSEIQSLGALRYLVSTGLVGRGIGGPARFPNEISGEQISLYFFPTNVRKHVTLHFDAGTQHLPALLDHFLALHRIIDDVTIFVRQVVFAHDSAHALAPAAG